MENWNENDWQGRRKDQIDFSTRVVTYCSLAFIGILIGALIINLF